MYTTEEMINQVIVNLNNLTISGVDNMSLIIDSIKMLASIQEGIKKAEETHKAQLDKLMDRIREINEAKGAVPDVCQDKG